MPRAATPTAGGTAHAATGARVGGRGALNKYISLAPPPVALLPQIQAARASPEEVPRPCFAALQRSRDERRPSPRGHHPPTWPTRARCCSTGPRAQLRPRWALLGALVAASSVCAWTARRHRPRTGHRCRRLRMRALRWRSRCPAAYPARDHTLPTSCAAQAASTTPLPMLRRADSGDAGRRLGECRRDHPGGREEGLAHLPAAPPEEKAQNGLSQVRARRRPAPRRPGPCPACFSGRGAPAQAQLAQARAEHARAAQEEGALAALRDVIVGLREELHAALLCIARIVFGCRQAPTKIAVRPKRAKAHSEQRLDHTAKA
jgi:hypothetical protein